ncbi:MAG: MraZ protein [Lentimonas sp.]|jgi:MraZ protein
MGRIGAVSLYMGVFNTGGFIGEFRHNLDDKGRLTIPSAWRPGSDGEGNYFLALPSVEEGASAYVTVYPPKMIQRLEERISQISMGDVEGQRMVAELMSMAHSFSCDKQGRMSLSEKLARHAQIKKSAVLLGKMSTFSIYSEELYNASQASGPSDPTIRAAVFKRFEL